MYLTTHVLLGVAVFGRQGDRNRTAAAVSGSLLPDMGSFAIVLKARLVDGYSSTEIYRDLYYSDVWQAFLAPWHSFFLWAGVLAVGILGRWPAVLCLAASALLASLTDLPLHSERTQIHSWPLSDWRFESPVSYWHPEHYGQIVQPIEFALAVGLTFFVFERHRSNLTIISLVALWLVYVAQFASYAMLFADPV